MYVVRPAAVTDIAALESLAAVATPGVHTLPRTRAIIEKAVERSLASFAAQVVKPSDESYMFVLESFGSDQIGASAKPDTSGSLIGAASIAAKAGAKGTFFAFRNDVIQQASRDLEINHSVPVLTLCSDLTDYSQLSSFYLRNWQNSGAEAALLSRSRLLYAVMAQHRFCDRFFVSLAGMTDAHSQSPFWEALGRKFFQMDFPEVERMVEGERNRSLIVELMPHYPIYVPILPQEAQAVMGRVHAEGELPFRILAEEGFESKAFIDIFDGGPILQAHKHALRSFSASQMHAVTQRELHSDAPDSGWVPYLVATGSAENFRATVVDAPLMGFQDVVPLSAQTMQALGVEAGQAGEAILCVRL